MRWYDAAAVAVGILLIVDAIRRWRRDTKNGYPKKGPGVE